MSLSVKMNSKGWRPDLGVAVIQLFQLKVFARLAGQVHPLSLKPLDGGLLQQIGSIHLGHKGDVLT